MDEHNHLERAAWQQMFYDPWKDAENQTGKSYKDDEETDQLGLSLGFRHVETQRALLQELDDTHYNSSWQDFLRIIGEEGFEILFEHYGGRPGKPQTDHHIIAFHQQQKMLLNACSHDGRINDWNVYFNREASSDLRWTLRLSGGLMVDLWEQTGRHVIYGDFQGVDGFRLRFRELVAQSSPVWPWMHKTYMSLHGYWEIDYDDPDLTSKQRNAEHDRLLVERLQACGFALTDFAIEFG